MESQKGDFFDHQIIKKKEEESSKGIGQPDNVLLDTLKLEVYRQLTLTH